MGMAVGGGAGGPKADINMTPMIDVLLVLIIIFMVITPLTPKGLEAMIPQPPPPNTPPTQADLRTVEIIIEKDGKLKLNEDLISSYEELASRLERVFKTRAERVVFVKGDPALDWSQVARVI